MGAEGSHDPGPNVGSAIDAAGKDSIDFDLPAEYLESSAGLTPQSKHSNSVRYDMSLVKAIYNSASSTNYALRLRNSRSCSIPSSALDDGEFPKSDGVPGRSTDRATFLGPPFARCKYVRGRYSSYNNFLPIPDALTITARACLRDFTRESVHSPRHSARHKALHQIHHRFLQRRSQLPRGDSNCTEVHRIWLRTRSCSFRNAADWKLLPQRVILRHSHARFHASHEPRFYRVPQEYAAFESGAVWTAQLVSRSGHADLVADASTPAAKLRP